MIFALGLGASVSALVIGIAWADDFFSRNWDSIYDPRSKYQIWRDNRRKQ